MQQQTPSIGYYHDCRRMKGNGKFPLKVAVTHLGKTKHCPTSIDATPEEWAIIHPLLNNPDLLEKVLTAVTEKQAVEKTVAKIIPFTLPAFTTQLEMDNSPELVEKENQYATGTGDIIPWFAAYLNDGTKRSIGTHKGYGFAKSMLIRYFKKEAVAFNELPGDELRAIQAWMLREGSDDGKPMSLATIGIYMRYIRAVFNFAMNDDNKAVAREFYPFGKGKKKYKIPKASGRKKSLQRGEIKTMSQTKVADGKFQKQIEKAIAYWMILYYCNGVNMKDLLLMKNKNIVEDIIYLFRAKTINKTEQKEIQIVISAPLKKLLNTWRNTDTDPEAYLFDILKPGMSEEAIYDAKNNFIRFVNKYLTMAHEMGILEKKTRTGQARNSVATLLANDGASILQIKEVLGHEKVETTMNYIGSLETELKKELAVSLTNFKRKKRA
jgi:integrase